MKKAGLCLFRSCCLYFSSGSPSLWTFSNAAPAHAQFLFTTYGVGLGINTMEGREQKHQQIEKYSKKAIYQERWKFMFRHEFIQVIYLRENGFDTNNYRKRNSKYIPEREEGHCICSLKLVNENCPICDSEGMKKVLDALKKIERKN